jgi:hypothetical protein
MLPLLLLLLLLLLLWQVLRCRLCEWRLRAAESPHCHEHLPAAASALLGVAAEPAMATCA